MSQKAHFLTYILDVLTPGVKFERPENREALVQGILAWHLAALKKARIVAMTECLGIASRHAAAEFVERDIRERLERLEALPPIEEGES